jgi:hypothetical protein
MATNLLFLANAYVRGFDAEVTAVDGDAIASSATVTGSGRC